MKMALFFYWLEGFVFVVVVNCYDTKHRMVNWFSACLPLIIHNTQFYTYYKQFKSFRQISGHNLCVFFTKNMYRNNEKTEMNHKTSQKSHLSKRKFIFTTNKSQSRDMKITVEKIKYQFWFHCNFIFVILHNNKIHIIITTKTII